MSSGAEPPGNQRLGTLTQYPFSEQVNSDCYTLKCKGSGLASALWGPEFTDLPVGPGPDLTLALPTTAALPTLATPNPELRAYAAASWEPNTRHRGKSGVAAYVHS